MTDPIGGEYLLYGGGGENEAAAIPHPRPGGGIIFSPNKWGSVF